MRSRLPGLAASTLAQPVTHATDVIFAGIEAKAPPERRRRARGRGKPDSA